MAYNANAVQCIYATGSFAAGATVATHNFKDAAGNVAKIPAGSMIVGGGLAVPTAVTSGGSATVQVKVGSTNLTSAIGKAALTANSGHNLDQVTNAAATGLLFNADTSIDYAVGTAALTAGVFHVYVLYVTAALGSTI